MLTDQSEPPRLLISCPGGDSKAPTTYMALSTLIAPASTTKVTLGGEGGGGAKGGGGVGSSPSSSSPVPEPEPTSPLVASSLSARKPSDRHTSG